MRRFFACIFLIAKKHAILVSQSRLGMKRGNYSEREREDTRSITFANDVRI